MNSCVLIKFQELDVRTGCLLRAQRCSYTRCILLQQKSADSMQRNAHLLGTSEMQWRGYVFTCSTQIVISYSTNYTSFFCILDRI